MEEAPQGTFQDELEWCILQLKTGLLCLNPTPEQDVSMGPSLSGMTKLKANLGPHPDVEKFSAPLKSSISEELTLMGLWSEPSSPWASSTIPLVACGSISASAKLNWKLLSDGVNKHVVDSDVWPDRFLYAMLPEDLTKVAEETRNILKVLCSHKAPFVKKQQVVNHMFRDYQLKMAEEQKRAEKAAMKPKTAQIQQGNAQASGSMAYRKRSGQTSESTMCLFTPSDNRFQFSFALAEMDPQATNGIVEEAQGEDGSDQRPISVSSSEIEDLSGALNFSTSGQGPRFAFNFVIPESDGPVLTSVVTGQRVERAAEDVSSDGLSSARPMEHATLLEANMPEVMGSVDGVLGRELPILETPKPESAPVDGVTAEKMAAAGAPRKKKKKKPSNIKKEVVETKVSKKEKVGTSGCEDTNEALQDKTMQHSDEQLWREVDWCVEQLELGLKTQKSTPKQAEEALRAIKTLRSDRAVLAKKRQIMRAMFGDYRKKMEEERQKQLKLMQAAAKSAQVMEVRENTRRKSSQVFRKRSGTSRKSLSPAGSPSHPPSHPDSPKALGTDSLVFSTSQEEFCFNFF